MYFGANVSYASLPVYLPTILSAMGYSSIDAQGLSAPPYFVAFLFALINTYIADRTQQRGWMLFATSIVGGVGYIILATVTTVGVRYFAVFLAAAGVFSTIPNIIAWTLSMQFLSISFNTLRLKLRRQPRLRQPSWRWACPDQCCRPVRFGPVIAYLSDVRRAAVHQGPIRLRCVYVLHCCSRFRSALPSCLG